MTYAPAMTRPALTHGWVRLARAGILGGASLFLATAGHALGGGTLPGAGLLALTGVAVTLIAVSLTARRVRFGTLFAVLSVQQVLLHLLFHAATAGTTAAGGATCAPVMPGHAMEPTLVCGSGTAATGGWSMLLGHALAVAATAWLLARGERWLWAVLDRIRRYAAARPTRRRPRPVVTVAVRRADPMPSAAISAGPRAPPVV